MPDKSGIFSYMIYYQSNGKAADQLKKLVKKVNKSPSKTTYRDTQTNQETLKEWEQDLHKGNSNKYPKKKV